MKILREQALEPTLGNLLCAAGFHKSSITVTPRKDCDQHWKTIGREKDDLETLRMEAKKW